MTTHIDIPREWPRPDCETWPDEPALVDGAARRPPYRRAAARLRHGCRLVADLAILIFGVVAIRIVETLAGGPLWMDD